jgi:chitin synthase
MGSKAVNLMSFILGVQLLLAWALSNGLLVVLILSGVTAQDTFGNTAEGAKTRAYMTFVLAFVAITNLVRFMGSTVYTIMVAITG